LFRIVGGGPDTSSEEIRRGLRRTDATLAGLLSKLALPRNATQPADPAVGCRKFWELVRVLMVADAADAGKINLAALRLSQ
jgi:hypothetical protein